MIITDVMAALATQLDTIAGLRVYDFPISKVVPPAVIVGYPESITYDLSANRGQDVMEMPLIAIVGKVSDRTAMDVLGPYMDGSGASSFKAVLEANNRTYTAFSRVRVRSATVEIVTIAGVEYLAGMFTCDIYGGN